MAPKLKTVTIPGTKPEDIYKNALKFAMSQKPHNIGEITINSQTGTLIVTPRDGAERTILGAWRGSGNLTNLLTQLYRVYDKQTILGIDDKKDYHLTSEGRAAFKAIAAAISKGDVEQLPEGEAVTEETTNQEVEQELEPEAEPETDELTAELEALGTTGEVTVTEETKTTEAAPVASAEAPAKEKTKKEKKPAAPPKPKSHETGTVMFKGVETPACRICGKALSQPKSVIRGIGPVCAAGMQKALNLSAEDFEILSNPEKTSDETWLSKVAEAREILEAKGELSEAPEGYVKLADVSRLCRENDIPVSRWVKAFGGDRNANEPEDTAFAPVFVGRTRYVPGNAFERLQEVVAAEAGKKKELVGAAKAAKEKADAKKAEAAAASSAA